MRRITRLPEADRPREKLQNLGPRALSPAELLAILIGSGNEEENAVELMQRLLADCDNKLANLSRLSFEQLRTYKGLGPAKACAILAAVELGLRFSREEPDTKRFNNCDAIRQEYAFLATSPTEECHVLLLNNDFRKLSSKLISKGGLTAALVDVRPILKEAILAQAVYIVLIHNHPSGNPRPSSDDDRITKNLFDAAKMMNIRLIDHIIIAANQFYSYSIEGKL